MENETRPDWSVADDARDYHKAKEEIKTMENETRPEWTVDDVVCRTLLDLSETLRAENNNAENSRSIRKHNKELINAITMIVKHYDFDGEALARAI
jgi:transcription elongation GreA/GreB family factor